MQNADRDVGAVGVAGRRGAKCHAPYNSILRRLDACRWKRRQSDRSRVTEKVGGTDTLSALQRGRRRDRLKTGADFLLVTWGEGEFAEGDAFLLVVFVELHRERFDGVGGFPAPFADRDELERHAFSQHKPGPSPRT